ncbi:MAG: hypothetical protein PQJ60_00155 [Spirochaetales bacterium]|nr:hypothetical protein [Spirochaetales bacterium]
MKKTILTLLFLASSFCLFGESLEYDFLNMNFAFAGELRARSAYLNNFDMDYTESDGDLAGDVRGRLKLKVTGQSPLYFKGMLEWGNVEISDDLSAEDLWDLEMRELYLGFKKSSWKVKAGIIDLETPGGYVYDSNEWGLQVKYDFSSIDLDIKMFYSAADLTEGTNESQMPAEYMDHLVFLGVHQEEYGDLDLDLWGMFYHGDTEEFVFNSYWFGTEGTKEISDFTVQAGYTCNLGNVVTYSIPLASHFSHLTVEYEQDKSKTLFSRFNLVTGSDGSLDSTGQFQNPDGEGNLDTGLGLLFGGSPYGSQAYFDNESLSIVSDNLCEGDISFYDPGLFVYETGMEVDFSQWLPLDLETQFVLGGANTGDLFDGEGYFYSLIGWEGDIHNKIEFSDHLEFALSLCYLIPGNSFNAVYELNYDDILDLDTSFKADCQIKYSF